jgi:hypothetical protein
MGFTLSSSEVYSKRSDDSGGLFLRVCQEHFIAIFNFLEGGLWIILYCGRFAQFCHEGFYFSSAFLKHALLIFGNRSNGVNFDAP